MSIQSIENGTQQPMSFQSERGSYARTFDVGRNIGLDRDTGQQTSTMTIITKPNNDLKTAFPGQP